MINFVNSWNSAVKQSDKIGFSLRLGKVTVVDVNIDIGDKSVNIMVFNIGIRIGPKA